LGKTKEAVGVMPAMGMKVVIDEIERGETGENAANPGALMYTATFRVIEPEQFKGATLREWFTIGTREDRRGKREETWRRSEGGPGRLVRMLKRAGVAITDDDEEWMEASEGAEVCLTVTKTRDRDTGEFRNRVGMYFREEDADFVGVGETTEADEDGGRRPGSARKAKPAAKSASANPRAKAKAAEDDEEDEDEPPKKKAKAKKPEPEEDDDDEEKGDDDDEDEEERPNPRAKKQKAAKKARREEEDDEDDDED